MSGAAHAGRECFPQLLSGGGAPSPVQRVSHPAMAALKYGDVLGGKSIQKENAPCSSAFRLHWFL